MNLLRSLPLSGYLTHISPLLRPPRLEFGRWFRSPAELHLDRPPASAGVSQGRTGTQNTIIVTNQCSNHKFLPGLYLGKLSWLSCEPGDPLTQKGHRFYLAPSLVLGRTASVPAPPKQEEASASPILGELYGQKGRRAEQKGSEGVPNPVVLVMFHPSPYEVSLPTPRVSLCPHLYLRFSFSLEWRRALSSI